MARVKLKANKLENATVQFISLVDRGANRIPFRIIKREENDMIDLDKMFKRDYDKKCKDKTKTQKQEAPPEIFSLIVSAGEHEAEVSQFFEGAGFSTDSIKKNEEGGYLSFDQKEYTPEEVEGLSVVKVDDGVVLLMKEDRIAKAAEGTIFDLQDDYGFYPSPANALSGLCQHVFEAVTKAETKEEAQVLVAKHLNDCAEFLTAYIDVVPDAIRTGDVETMVTKFETQKEEAVDEKGQEAPQAAAAEAEAQGEQAQEEEVAQKAEAPAPDFMKAMEAFSSKIEGMFTGLNERVVALKTDIDSLHKDNQKVSLKLEAVDAVAKSAASAVKSTLNAAPTEEDRLPGGGVRKAENLTGTFDTAFLPKRRHF